MHHSQISALRFLRKSGAIWEARKKSKSHLDSLIDDAVYYGLTPGQAKEMEPAEMARFVNLRRKMQNEQLKQIAHVAYSAGLIASMALSDKRPSFDEVFRFDDERPRGKTAEVSKLEMLALAENMNRFAGEEE